jgi:acetyl-CoA synthetase (ADP-forming)
VSRHLNEVRAKAWVAEYGVRVPRGCYARDLDQAVSALAELHPPLVVKLVSRALHKSEIGGVRVGVHDTQSLCAAIESIERAAGEHGVAVEGYLVEEMAPRGVEMLVGGIVDPVFGPAVLVGLGGIFTEVLDDVVARICPIGRDDACDMIHELRCAPLLLGARGQPPADVAALGDVLLALGGRDGLLLRHEQSVREIDLNPVIVSSEHAIAVDARVILREELPSEA